MVHELLTQPNYNGDSTTFIFHISDEQAMVQLRHHITQLVKVPVFPEWTSYLWHAGQTAMLLRPTRTGGDVKLYTVVLDCDAWTTTDYRWSSSRANPNTINRLQAQIVNLSR